MSGDRNGPGTGWTSGPGRDVRALYGARVERLPQRTRELLLLAALEGADDIGFLEAAGGPGGLEDSPRSATTWSWSRSTAAPCASSVRWWSAVVDGSTGEQRRDAHRQLADALADRPERRGGHLTRATTVPDEAVAAVIKRRPNGACGAATQTARSPGCGARPS